MSNSITLDFKLEALYSQQELMSAYKYWADQLCWYIDRNDPKWDYVFDNIYNPIKNKLYMLGKVDKHGVILQHK